MIEKPVIGVLGGMGPLATADLYRKIITSTPAHRDQEHVHVIIDADPSVPDRTEALLHGGADPTPWLIAGARRLEAAGATFIVMPCNTAHAFLERVQPTVTIPFISMIEETAQAAAALNPRVGSVGILATEGTLASELYQRAFATVGIQPLTPTEPAQHEISAAIASVKAGAVGREVTERLLVACRELIEAGADALIAACTELPIVLQQSDVAVPLIDPTDVLARAAVGAARATDATVRPVEQGAAVHANRA